MNSGIGIRVAHLIRSNGVSINKLANSIDVAQSAIGKIVRGETLSPGADIVLKIADYFQVSCDYLIRGAEPGAYTATATQTNSGAVVQEGAAQYGVITQSVGAAGGEELAKCREELAKYRGQVELLKEMMMNQQRGA